MISDKKQLIATHIDLSWNQGRFDKDKAFLADSFHYKTTFTDEILNAVQYFEIIAVLREAMPDLSVEIELIMSEENTVMTQVTFIGEIIKPFYGIPVSEKIISFPAVTIWEVDNNRIVSADTLIDMTGVSRQVGAPISPQIPLGVRAHALLNVESK